VRRLVIRRVAFGDLIFSLPALECLRHGADYRATHPIRGLRSTSARDSRVHVRAARPDRRVRFCRVLGSMVS
jgi:hypothetical protein